MIGAMPMIKDGSRIADCSIRRNVTIRDSHVTIEDRGAMIEDRSSGTMIDDRNPG